MFGEHGRARVRAARGFTSPDRAGPPIYLYHPGGWEMLGLCFHSAPEVMLRKHGMLGRSSYPRKCWLAAVHGVKGRGSLGCRDRKQKKARGKHVALPRDCCISDCTDMCRDLSM